MAGYEAVLDLHERSRVPASLHLSGTLVEACAWGAPRFLDRVRRLVETGLLRLVGGTYAENVMPLFDERTNREQLDEAFAVYAELLGCPPQTLRTFWVPERVWDPSLAALLADPSLPNGGYERVLLDDRLLFRGAEREAFDRSGPYGRLGEPAPPEACRAYRMQEAPALTVVPISAALRYWVPPHSQEQLALVAAQAAALAGRPGALLVYADDLEKTAGVAGWAVSLERFERFLAWLAGADGVAAVELDGWLDAHPPAEERPVEAGTFHELAVEWGAGEDYRGWADVPGWAPYRPALEQSAAAVDAARAEVADDGLLRLARRHVLASAHETAWHDPAPDGPGRAPAPWARALASHARHARMLARLALALAGPGTAGVEEDDLDDDGEAEILLRAGSLAAVVSPAHGGRLLYLAEPGRLLVGNPTDHWNFQEELHRFMRVPQNHPGAFADEGGEHDAFVVEAAGAEDGCAAVVLRDVAASRGEGLRKRLAVDERGFVSAWYELPPSQERCATVVCVSPDYERLVRLGRRGVRPLELPSVTGWENGEAAVWVAVDGETASLAEPLVAEAGHGFNVRVEGRGPAFGVVLGRGAPEPARVAEALAACRRVPIEAVP